MPVVVHTFTSEVLRGNAMGDPIRRRVAVYLPPGHEDATGRYAVVYFLAGFSSRGSMLLNESAWDENLPQRLDRLIGEGSVRPLILVLPDCMTRLGGSQYINSTATGRYEDHLIHELVPFIDATHPTHARPDQRAVMGKSSGGYGATVLAMRHPDVFGLCADHSGDKYFELCYKADIPSCVAGLARYEHSVERFLADFPHPAPERDRNWFSTTNLLAMASCYSPNSTAPAGFDLPFDSYTAEIKDDVWQRWLEHDPVRLVDRYADALRRLHLYYLDCGQRDEYHLQYGARIYSRRLRELDIPHRYEEFSGGHRATAHRYDHSLRALSEVFSATGTVAAARLTTDPPASA